MLALRLIFLIYDDRGYKYASTGIQKFISLGICTEKMAKQLDYILVIFLQRK